MNKKSLITLILSLDLCYVPLSMAEVGITDACQDDVKELQDKMRDNKDDYTAESRRKANTQLTAAKTNRLNPVKCRGNIRDARQELKQGKRDKRNRN